MSLTLVGPVAWVRMEPLLELERLGDLTWPALERIEFDAWLVRFGGGVTRRSNSVTPLGRSSRPLAEKIAVVEGMFAERGLPPIFRMTPLAEPPLAELLEARGYERDLGARVMTRTVDDATIPDPRVRCVPEPDVAWMQALSGFGDDRGDRSGMAALLARVDRGTYASIADDGVVAIGMATAANGCVGIFNMNTRPDRRNRGLGRAILRTLLAWGRTEGADLSLLQVHPTSRAAIALYHAEGFEDRYAYTYQIHPGRSAASQRPVGSAA